MSAGPEVLRWLADKLDFISAEWPENTPLSVTFSASRWRQIIAALRSPQGDWAEDTPSIALLKAQNALTNLSITFRVNGRIDDAYVVDRASYLLKTCQRQPDPRQEPETEKGGERS